MEYDIAIATRNRSDALDLSIPLFIGQSERPKSIVIVDSSDDPKPVARVIEKILSSRKTLVPIKLLRSKPNLPLQRNIALKYIDAPVVMFPDDDSMWWPDVAKSILEIYRSDINSEIGGVCGKETSIPPPCFGDMLDFSEHYRMKHIDTIRQKIARNRHIIENKLIPDPLWIHGRSYWKTRSNPKCITNFDAALVEFMGGFRMSFRTDIIKKYGFDEDLGRYIGYAAYEDADASFKVLQTKALVGAHDSLVFHYKSPQARANGFPLGFILIFNRAYIICKYSSRASMAKEHLKRFTLFKAAQYSFALGTSFGRERFLGTLIAYKKLSHLLNSPRRSLRESYLNVCHSVLANKIKK